MVVASQQSLGEGGEGGGSREGKIAASTKHHGTIHAVQFGLNIVGFAWRREGRCFLV